jgi:glycosyltransferase involved in cell wall biosynthesis
MKIVMLLLNTSGGMVHYVSQLANALSSSEDIVVIAPIGIDKSNFDRRIRILELRLGNTIRNLALNTFLVGSNLKVIRTIRREKPDVIHCTEAHPWLGLLLPMLKGYPLVTTIHDTHPHLGSRRLDHRIALLFHTRFSDCIVVHGEKARSELKGGKSCFVVPLGDFSFFSNFNAGPVNEEPSTLLFFGSIEKRKGLEYLIEAVNTLSIKSPKIRLIIAGKGDMSNYVGLMRNAEIFEIHNRFIPDDEVGILFRRASMVVLPYTEITQSGIVSIAYAFKKPVVATAVGDIPEMVENMRTGLIVPPGDSRSLLEAISFLLDHEDTRNRFGENGYMKMKKDLSWKGVAEKVLIVYEKAIGEGKAITNKTNT